jgi:hypothetical protein
MGLNNLAKANSDLITIAPPSKAGQLFFIFEPCDSWQLYYLQTWLVTHP